MKIKRFEAENMSEALRMVKKEFGEDAVILSAKTRKKSGRLLGLGSGAQVVVTAAIDYETAQAPDDDNARDMDHGIGLQGVKAREAARPGPGIGRILQQFTPITRTGLNKMQPKIVQLMNESLESSDRMAAGAPDQSIYEVLLDQGMVRSVAGELADRVAELAPSQQQSDEEILTVLSQIIEAQGWVAPGAVSTGDRRIVAVVGPCGAGKTTTIAKMAARSLMQGRPRVGIISLDDQRIAGTVEIEKYADILGVPFERAEDESCLNQALQRFGMLDLILLDTPGLGPDERPRRENLARVFERLPNSEIHLLMHAGAREEVIIKTIEFFRPLGVNRLMPTHVDWCRQIGPVVSQAVLNHVAIGYLGTGAQVPEGIQRLTARSLAAMLLSMDDEEHGEKADASVTIVQRRGAGALRDQYVANRNSDIFHHQQCKAVSRINDDNILMFKDPDEAMDQGFKPCRMCCMSLFAPKPIDRPARRRIAGLRN